MSDAGLRDCGGLKRIRNSFGWGPQSLKQICPGVNNRLSRAKRTGLWHQLLHLQHKQLWAAAIVQPTPSSSSLFLTPHHTGVGRALTSKRVQRLLKGCLQKVEAEQIVPKTKTGDNCSCAPGDSPKNTEGEGKGSVLKVYNLTFAGT